MPLSFSPLFSFSPVLKLAFWHVFYFFVLLYHRHYFEHGDPLHDLKSLNLKKESSSELDQCCVCWTSLIPFLSNLPVGSLVWKVTYLPCTPLLNRHIRLNSPLSLLAVILASTVSVFHLAAFLLGEARLLERVRQASSGLSPMRVLPVTLYPHQGPLLLL